MSNIDIVFVHDVAQDFYGEEWLSVFESARKGAFNTLDRLRDEGVIKAWGLGVNRVEPIELLLALEEPRPDGFLLAGRYTLLDHSRALQRVIPMVAEHELAIVVGGPYSSGALVGGPNFEYAPAPPEIINKVRRIKAIADRHGISMKAAGLQFALEPRAARHHHRACRSAWLSLCSELRSWAVGRSGRQVPGGGVVRPPRR